jgi:hypothetical protein
MFSATCVGGAMTQPTHLLPDEDVHAAMRAMSGYIDITTEDFREIYTLAH